MPWYRRPGRGGKKNIGPVSTGFVPMYIGTPPAATTRGPFGADVFAQPGNLVAGDMEGETETGSVGSASFSCFRPSPYNARKGVLKL